MKLTTHTLIAAVTFYGLAETARAAAPPAPQGVITAHEYVDIPGVAIADLTNNVKFPNSPDIVAYAPFFEWPTTEDGSPPPADVKNNYGVQLIGYLYPPTTGEYVFALASDDFGRLYLSTDENPVNKVLIAQEPEWNPVRSFASEARRPLVDVGTPFERRINVSRPITLTQGRAYYIEALMKEGIGGDNVAVAWQMPGGFLPQDADPPIPGEFLSAFGKNSGPVTITQQPTNSVVGENQPATFRVVVDGTPPYTFQWQRGTTDIPDATNDNYTLPSAALSDNGAQFRVQVANALANATSSAATLTVSSDTTAPTITKVSGSGTFTDVTVIFSEPVSAATAGNRANYALDGGLTLSAATVVNETTVRLTTSRQTSGTSYTLTVNNIRDASTAGNLIATNTRQSFTAWVFSRGFAQHKFFENVTPNNIMALTDDPRFPDSPTFVTFEPAFEYPPNGGNEAGSDYGNQLVTFLIPPVTGDYIFYCSGDDPVELYISLDEDPANKTLIAREPVWNNARQWRLLDRRDPDFPENVSQPIALVAGQRYFLEALHTEGGGGDSVGATWQLPGAPEVQTGDPPIRGPVMGIYANPDDASLTITEQPQSVTIIENTPATFSVTATGSVASLAYQWQRTPTGSANFADVALAVSRTYTTAPLPASESGAQFRVLVSVPGLTRTSDVATVTITSDREPPTLVAARRNFNDATKVKVVFSEQVTAATANVAANYSINNNITVSGAVLQADNRTVELTTSAINQGTSNTLTVNGVRDLVGNTIAVNSQIAISFERGVLLTVANSAPSLNSGDTAIKNRLEARGYFVEVTGASAAEVTMTEGKDLVITSSTINSGDLADRFQPIPVPVINWEQALQDDFLMTGNTDGTDRGTQGPFSSVEIVNPSHPLAAGLSGTVRVVTGTTTFSWGNPNNNAAKVGIIPGNTLRSIIYGYEKGAILADDATPAPERRVMLFMGDDSAATFTEDGWRFFDAAVDWAQNIAPPATGARLSIARSGANVIISWSPGGTLESADAVAGPWNTVTGATSPHTVAPTGNARFYRVRQ